ncbi:MAG TPA: UDP-3-O-(3-hydroxymyristoyl)glucosamine N-acyltransferase [candidate division Zixibacteria bacterium]|nr:UDP-3-O-(3-hydroxymyristoyl)glucosamine N-acyltransferase [candidate division Zixibacteria bacterium]MDD4916993.1 UDP-3-O-(3-hydroxymyristoyl)glucosamine N-acyltransferase [candidate division Zixibacteria bacterium]MDM7972616.1 UDP-3-O-(3-hydroxymyristoyl)glucosamine N-acyltransferase [candidate division Zixibacteria bacterium]HOD66174.1 UDP-3-O-(3-hydroxymyristoyl)glucosamine N-acyltransferase [candidate division Zixibacteria bacterium]HPC10596.1 UDP-3-O-(3-hydroxymyristoyl)glucosamine N-ac
MAFTVAYLAERVGGTVAGDGSVEIGAAAPIETAGPGDISFIANPRYARFLATTRAGAVVVSPQTECPRLPLIRHAQPYLAFACILDLLYPDERLVAPGIDPRAVVAAGAVVDPTAGVGALCHIREGVRIGAGTELVSSVFVGRDVVVGDNCRIYPGVCLMDGTRLGNNVIIHSSTVIGSDGFGFAPSPTGLKKIKQVGWVEIDDDVEIGSNCSVDRGALGPTRIGRGTKIDNLVQIAHNVEIGRHAIIVSQVGISGSTRVGNGVVLAGQVGLVGHIEVGDGVQVGAQSGVARSVPAGKKVFGSPARDLAETGRIEAALVRLPELLKRVRRLEDKLGGE